MIFHLIQIFGAETSQNLRGEIIWLMFLIYLKDENIVSFQNFKSNCHTNYLLLR